MGINITITVLTKFYHFVVLLKNADKYMNYLSLGKLVYKFRDENFGMAGSGAGMAMVVHIFRSAAQFFVTITYVRCKL